MSRISQHYIKSALSVFFLLGLYLRQSKANAIYSSSNKVVKYQYGKVEIDIPFFMHDIAAVGTADIIRKGTQICRRMEIEKKMI